MKYKYNTDDGEKVITEEEVIAIHLPVFTAKMFRLGKADAITPENCVADWVITSWAWEYIEDKDANNPDGHRDV